MITRSRLHELLDYDPATGVFVWKVSRRGTVKAGDVAGKRNADGYTLIKIDGKAYMAHLLAWLYVHGEWPAVELDHRDRVRSNNRIDNLREASRRQNCGNSGGWANKPSGLPKGVTFDKQRGAFMARISVNGKSKNLGRFNTENEAAAAYQAAAKKEFGEYAAA